MVKAFNYPTADRKLEKDEWGVTLSGYAPIRDKNGRAVAVLGVDMDAADVYKIQRGVHMRALIVLFLGVLLSLFLGKVISRKFTAPIERLVRGTRHIAEGNLQYRVDVRGRDEVSELAHAFNKMAGNLDESRRKLLNYFYDVVQALVRSLEAKDHYTRGHSERVAVYSEKIARKMGFPKEMAALLKEAAVLHDIGKLGIHEDILNKKDRLTDQEWEIIKQHPIVGEDILRPVLLTQEMLAMVRSHHERYDGRGYPDKLMGENISIFAAIISVADAYDAMTSPRAYRGDLGREKAVEELKKHKGAQFNEKVVDAVLHVLKENE
jgi:putative nucleotidyltransferase with HDIG domain